MLDLLARLSSSVLQTVFLGHLLHLLPPSTPQIHSMGVSMRGHVRALPSDSSQKSGNLFLPMISNSTLGGSPDRDGAVVRSGSLGSGVRQTWMQTLHHSVLAVLSGQDTLRLSYGMRWAWASSGRRAWCRTGFGIQESLHHPSPAQDSI